MSLAKKLLDMHEAQHYNTKVRGIDASMGSRKIRLGLKESKKAIRHMLNNSHPAPNPRTKQDAMMLDESLILLDQTSKRLKEVKESKKSYNEDLNEKEDVQSVANDIAKGLKKKNDLVSVKKTATGLYVDLFDLMDTLEDDLTDKLGTQYHVEVKKGNNEFGINLVAKKG